MKVSIEKLGSALLNIVGKNYKTEEAQRIIDVLLWADMSGIDTQGIIKLTGTEPLQNIQPKHEIKIERDKKFSVLINAGAHPAPLVCQQATDIVIEKAKEYGMSIVGIHNTYSSNGAQSFYVDRIAQENLVGIMASRSPAAVAPFNSIDALFGTNPIGFSFPTNKEPLLFDMATSALTWYGLVQAKANGKKIPGDVAIDKNGNRTNDPTAAMNGALLPFDRSYKGSGLGLVVELLAGPFVHAGFGDLESEWGTILIAIDPDLMGDVQKFKDHSSTLIEMIRKSRSQTGEKVRLPGEQARKKYTEAMQSGLVDIDPEILQQLKITL